MKFSQRIGKKQARAILQKDSIDDVLRNKLWNCFYNEVVYYLRRHNSGYFDLIKRDIWEDFLNKRVDEFPYGEDGVLDAFKVWYFNVDWFEIYDFLEFLCDYDKDLENTHCELDFIKNCNFVLEQQLSAYRIINYRVTPISDEVEITSIEKALDVDDKFKEVSTHLNTSMSYLSNRESPDYRNSIKESISAVETICKIVTGEKTLGKALNNLEKSGLKIHPSMKAAFEKLYVYTNDSKTGIRHAMIEANYSPDFDEAKFMLVTCSTFINYLKAKSF